MHGFEWTTLATCAASLLTIVMGIRTGGARRKTKIAAPAMTGDPLLERNIRVHMNTLEWFPVFLASMWLFALYWDDRIAAALGAVWVIARIIYMVSYVKDPSTRTFGFTVQALTTLALLGGAVWGAVSALLH
jgi:uncharacterized MAPEG superfamily protein